MTDLPTHVDIHEEGPREAFQIEPGPISTADKIKLTSLASIASVLGHGARRRASASIMPRC